MKKLNLININVFYDDFHAVKDVSLDIDEGQIICLLGPSGCGKTSILRAIAGFIQPSSGSVHLEGEEITRFPPQKRNMGMIFQNYALWPHMTVKNNISYGLKIRKMKKDEINEIVNRLVDQVKLQGQEKKYPTQLSGGQQQRVALARAVAIEPTVLLCDEPLSNLDFKLRVDLRTEIRDIAKKLGITVVYVTHDQTEALAISDKIAVIDEGVIIQTGPPYEIYNDPDTLFVATFIGENNIIDGIVKSHNGKVVSVELKSGEIIQTTIKQELTSGDNIKILTRYDAIVFRKGEENQLLGKIKSKSFMGAFLQIVIELNDGTLVSCNIDEDIPKFDAMALGESIPFNLDAENILIFKDEIRIR